VLTDATSNVTVASTATSGKYALTNSLSGKTTYATPGWINTTGLSAVVDEGVRVGYIN